MQYSIYYRFKINLYFEKIEILDDNTNKMQIQIEALEIYFNNHTIITT